MIKTIKQRIIYMTKTRQKINSKLVMFINKLARLFGHRLQKIRKDQLIQTDPTRDLVQKNSLLWFYGNIYSQRGQDGILREIFKRLGVKTGTFVEFGAMNGITLSNCRLLFEKRWHGLFIEMGNKEFTELQKNYAGFSSIVCLKDLVSVQNPVDKIVREKTRFKNIDFVSIDIDGLDLDVALSSNLTNLGVKVVLLEGGFNFDPRLTKEIPNETAKNNIGQPLAVIIQKMKGVGYEPICFFQDTYFVRAEYISRFQETENDPVSLYCDAYNFMGEGHREDLLATRRSSGLEKFEEAENIKFMERLK